MQMDAPLFPTTSNIVGCWMLHLFAHPVTFCYLLLGVVAQSFNPLSPNDDQHQFSPNNIHTLLRDYVIRINNNNDHQRENALIFY